MYESRELLRYAENAAAAEVGIIMCALSSLRRRWARKTMHAERRVPAASYLTLDFIMLGILRPALDTWMDAPRRPSF